MPLRDQAWPDGAPSWADCQVDDVDGAAAFYGELFGWQLEEGPPEAGGYLMATKDGRAVAGLGPKPEGMESMPSVWTTYLAVDDVDKTAAAVTEGGGTVMMDPFDVMTAGRMTVVADPQGAVVGLWQSRDHSGAEIYREDGTLAWQELHTHDYEGARSFFAGLFGYSYEDVGDGESLTYCTFTKPGVEGALGGIMLDPAMPDEIPGYWMTWFEVSDCDAVLETAVRLGSTSLMGPNDSPYGRMAVVWAPQGEMFGLMDSGRRIDPEAADGS